MSQNLGTERQLDALIADAAAADMPYVNRSAGLDDSTSGVFVGSGDSLAASLVAQRFGHRAMSAGDLAWFNAIPAQTKVVVGVSQSGRTGATVLATRAAKNAGVRTVAVTTDPSSPLALSADQTQLVQAPRAAELVPCAGYLFLGIGVLATCGADVTDANRFVAAVLHRLKGTLQSTAAALITGLPQSISILTLPDFRSAGDFWSLKLMEATGVTVRTVPLEEAGHVDYFIGPQKHLVLQLIGQAPQRHQRLGDALSANGHHVVPVDLTGLLDPGSSPSRQALAELAVGATGALLAELAANLWSRQLFRGGVVDMSGAHIALPI